MQVPNGTGPGVREVSVLCWLIAPVAMFHRNFQNLRNKVKIGNKVKFGNKVANWCNILSIVGVIKLTQHTEVTGAICKGFNSIVCLPGMNYRV